MPQITQGPSIMAQDSTTSQQGALLFENILMKICQVGDNVLQKNHRQSNKNPSASHERHLL